MIKTKELKFKYKKGSESFSFPDIALQENEHLLILGKSGVGKTTFLHLLAGLLAPTNGTILIDDIDINTLSPSKLDTFRGQHIGLVFQKKHAIQSLSVLEILKARLFFSKKTSVTANIEEVLKSLDLDSHKNSNINTLSEGQLQRLSIAMAVVHQPKLILADEPTSSLDDDNCFNVIDLLKKQAKTNNANLVVITHDSRVKERFKNTIEL